MLWQLGGVWLCGMQAAGLTMGMVNSHVTST